MEIKIDVPRYNSTTGLKYNWEDGFDISVTVTDNIVTLRANKAGLISLANHLLNLSQPEVPVGFHMHFDEINSLEENSSELVIEKM